MCYTHTQTPSRRWRSIYLCLADQRLRLSVAPSWVYLVTGSNHFALSTAESGLPKNLPSDLHLPLEQAQRLTLPCQGRINLTLRWLECQNKRGAFSIHRQESSLHPLILKRIKPKGKATFIIHLKSVSAHSHSLTHLFTLLVCTTVLTIQPPWVVPRVLLVVFVTTTLAHGGTGIISSLSHRPTWPDRLMPRQLTDSELKPSSPPLIKLFALLEYFDIHYESFRFVLPTYSFHANVWEMGTLFCPPFFLENHICKTRTGVIRLRKEI